MSEDRPREEISESEIIQRRDNAIRRALNTPPKPHNEIVGKGKRAGAGSKSRVKNTKDRA